MRAVRWLSLVVAMVVLPLIVGAGCPSAAGQFSVADLTAQEKAAAASMLASAAALSEAAGVTQSPADTENHAAASLPGAVSFGTCPVITTAIGSGAVDLTIDFGALPCVPAVFPGLSCAGSATGSFSAATSSIAVTFNTIGCSGKSLTGQAEVTFSLSQTGVDLSGTVDLGWLSDGENITTAGAGQLHYDRTAKTTTIASFSGTTTNADGAYTAVCADLVVSYQNNVNLVPSSGTIALSGPNIRSLTIRFNENSPSTGEVEVSIAGSAFFTVNLSEL